MRALEQTSKYRAISFQLQEKIGYFNTQTCSMKFQGYISNFT